MLTTSSGRGFASMPRDRVRAIASQGGKEAHARGTAHEFTTREAALAGRKGGQSRGSNIRRRQEIDRSNRSSGLSPTATV